jgi:8-amino-7-oxononanoate synthase
MKLEEKMEKQLNRLEQISRLRSLDISKIQDSGEITQNGKTYLNLSSNDYLNIASSKKLRKEFLNSCNLEELSFGSTSSRLMSGNSIHYLNVENILKNLYKREALVFSSGYHLNSGIFQALASKDDIIFSDKLNHASIVDGIRLSRADFFRFPHLNYNKLEKMIETKRKNYKNAFLVTESVFSMDGDLANLQKLIHLKHKYNLFLIVDEAHGFGVFGEKGMGVCETQQLQNDIDLIIGTFGKATGSEGAFAICSNTLKKWLINKTRPFIYTTALPPITLKWLEFSLQKLISFEKERKHLKHLWISLREELKKYGFETFGNSQIVPIIAKKDKDALKMAEKLKSNGYFALAVRPPTVPENSARIRISLNCAHKTEKILKIPAILKS